MSNRQKFLIKLYAFLWCALWCCLILGRGFELIRFALLAVFLAIPACSAAPAAQNQAAEPAPPARLREYLKKLRRIFYDAKNTTVCKLSLFFLLSLCLYTAVLLYVEGESLRIVRNWLTFYIIGAGAVYYLGWNALRHIVISLGTGLVISFILIALHNFFPDIKPFIPTYAYKSTRLSLYMSHPNNLGTLAGWGCCLLCYCRFNKVNIVNNAVDILLFIFMFVVIILTSSRTGLLSCLCILICMLAVYKRRHLKKIVPAILCIYAIFFIIKPEWTEKHTTGSRLASVLRDPIADETIQSRRVIWKIALELIKQKPVLGHGPRSFKNLYNVYVATHIEELRKTTKSIELNIHHPHNLALGLLADMGVIGLLLFSITLFLLFYGALKHPPPFSLGAFAIIFCAVVGITEYTIYTDWRAAQIFTACGFIFSGRAEDNSA
jgi:O-antigen ligase